MQPPTLISEPIGFTSRYSEPPSSLSRSEGYPIYVSPCDVGLGVFAARDLWPGEVILEFGGPIIDFAETRRRGPRECMAIQIGKNRYIDTQAPGVYVNHSCLPNAGVLNDTQLVALRRIRSGEEIRFDYSTTMEEQSFTMDCACGEPCCRKSIRDFSTLPEAVKLRYLELGIVMRFIAESQPARSVR